MILGAFLISLLLILYVIIVSNDLGKAFVIPQT